MMTDTQTIRKARFRNYPEWVHLEFVNWCRFCWSGPYPHPLPPIHCTSIEYRYMAPSDMGNENDPPPKIMPNVRNAMIVQGVYEDLPIHQKMVIRAEYPQRFESGRAELGISGAARRLKMSMGDYEIALAAAIGKVWDSFEKGRF